VQNPKYELSPTMTLVGDHPGSGQMFGVPKESFGLHLD
jgi:hypothetical protein